MIFFYDARPEFAKNGKEKITLSDVLRHEDGVYTFDEVITVTRLYYSHISSRSMHALAQVFMHAADSINIHTHTYTHSHKQFHKHTHVHTHM